ncbi:hypothetical protein [Frigidibacter oleivorans]|uniref:hypothetical protein n=1 Tax=Frigidibacter oleivorans TaxID=2487129 RepID=UPI000F8DEECE|nr:hypothetical protein [Frigidibacter oleivorans]
MPANERDDEAALLALFADLRAAEPLPPADFLARVLADAETEADLRDRLAATPEVWRPATARPRRSASLARRLREGLAGWGAAAGGLVSAASVGLWLGASGLATGLPGVGSGMALVPGADSAAQEFDPFGGLDSMTYALLEPEAAE